MKRRYQLQWILAAALMAPVAPAMLGGQAAAETAVDSKDLNKRAKAANTPEEHADVARDYVTRARALERKAESIERELRDQRSGPANPMAYKWPAMVSGREKKESLAMQTRRAAREAYALAELHSKRAGRSLDELATAVD